MKRAIFALFLLLPTACEEEAESDAPALCQQFVAGYCETVSRCTTLAASECRTDLAAELQCETARSVRRDDFQRCLADLQTAECSAFIRNEEINLPPSCAGAIEFMD